MVKNRKYFYLSFACILFLGLSGFLNAISVHIDLPQLEKIDDGQGNLLPTVYLGEDFTINITITQADRKPYNVTVEGLNTLNILVQNKQMHHSIINNSVSSHITYSYTVSTSKEGIYTIGPAYVTDNGTKVQSAAVQFRVIKSSPERHTRKIQTDKAAGIETPNVLVDLKLSKEQCVVGEQLEATLHIAYSGPVVNIGFAQLPQFKGFLSREIKQDRNGTEEIDGITHKFIEKKYIISPLQPGEKNINSAHIAYDYRQPKKKSRNSAFFGHDLLSDFFDMNTLRNAVATSNAVIVHVDPLPDFRGKVDGVGHFTKLSASFDKQEATQNEPVVLKISLTGQANLDQITDFNPCVPDGVKWYKSKAESKQQSELGGMKEFEYIVQIPHVGTIEFPPQAFTFFDTLERSYKTLQTQPLAIQVKPAPEGTISSQPLQELKKETLDQKKENSKPDEKQIDIHFIEEDSFAHKKQPPSLPLWLFIIIILIPLLFSQRALLQSLSKKTIFKKRSHKKSLEKCDTDLVRLVENGDASGLYHFFMNFFALKYNTPASEITEHFIAHQLNNIGMEPEKIDEFLMYLNECASLYFTSATVSIEHQNKLAKRAKYWYLVINK